MKGTTIIASANPQGKFLEGTISGTPKPGVVMQIKASTEPTNGRYTYEPIGTTSNGGDGAPRQVIVLLEDAEQGKTFDDAYESGKRCRLYCPIPGEELNLRRNEISGTGSATEDISIGERLLVVEGTGKLSPVAVGIIASPVSYPFYSLETKTDPLVEDLILVSFTGY